MGLHGVGVDVVDLHRFSAVIERHGERFLERWFSRAELAQTGDRVTSLARSFAAKEAVWKALQLPIPHLVWRDIEATGTDLGLSVLLTGQVRSVAQSSQVGAIHLTSSRKGNLVIATALVERVI